MKSIYNVILRPFVILSIITAMLLTVSFIYILQTDVSDNLYNISEDYLQTYADQTRLWLEHKASEISRLSYLWRDYEFSDTESLLFNMQAYLKAIENSFESIGYIDLNGNKITTSGAEFNISDRGYYEHLLESSDSPTISNPIYSRADNAYIILILCPIYDSLGQYQGHLSGSLEIAYLQNIITKPPVDDSSVYIVNNDDEILLGGTNKNTGDLLTITSEKIADTDWQVALKIPTSLVQSTVNDTIVITLFICLFILAVSFVLAKIFADKIARPIIDLQNELDTLSFDTITSFKSDSDIAELHLLSLHINDILQRIEKEKVEKLIAENKALYSQIQPHFLYNTLETIQSIAYDNDDLETEDAIGALATLFKIGLSSDKQIITLGDEILHLKSYVAIQKLRYSDMFEIEINNGDLSQDMPFMKFLLQPIVENAIYHGIKLMDQGGMIYVEFSMSERFIIATVKNSYKTIDKDAICTLNSNFKQKDYTTKSDKGYGLYNINQRLKINFGDDYGVEIGFDENYVTTTVYHPILERPST